MKKCPMCAEEILDEAIKCKHCGEMLGASDDSNDRAENDSKEKIKEGAGCAILLITFIFPGVGQMMKGNSTKGVTFLLLAIIIGVFTVGIGYIVMGFISAGDSDGLIVYKCPRCKSIVPKDASICSRCQTQLLLC